MAVPMATSRFLAAATVQALAATDTLNEFGLPKLSYGAKKVPQDFELNPSPAHPLPKPSSIDMVACASCCYNMYVHLYIYTHASIVHCDAHFIAVASLWPLASYALVYLFLVPNMHKPREL